VVKVPDPEKGPPRSAPDAAQQAETALKALREAQGDAARRRALDALERAMRSLGYQLRKIQPNNATGRE
jgi:hypothetical protein